MTIDHYKNLEKIWLLSPINEAYPPTVEVLEKESTISVDARPDQFHFMGAIHGAVYFKLLDDSAYFAAASMNDESPMLTASFTTNISKPVSSGRIKAIGKVVKVEGKKIYTESVMFDEEGNEIAKANGLFLPAKTKWTDVQTYNQG